jgi:hypothetical protein
MHLCGFENRCVQIGVVFLQLSEFRFQFLPRDFARRPAARVRTNVKCFSWCYCCTERLRHDCSCRDQEKDKLRASVPLRTARREIN